MKYSLNYVIRTDRINSKGLCPIYLRYTYQRKWKNLPIKYSINPENWDKENSVVKRKYSNYNFILPIHPNPNIQKHKGILTNVNIINPLNHDDLIKLLIKCSLVITDSGGLQEECSFFNKKCLVCRETTERPESISMTTFLVKEPELLVDMFDYHIKNVEVNFECPFGDGYASEKISKILKNIL